MGYEPTDHWIILDHWITKGSHMSSSCLVYHIVIFVKLSAIKNTCRKRSYYIYNTYIAFCLLETKHQIIWSNHFITKRPSRLAGKGSESLLCEAAGSFATRGGWAAAWDSGDGQNLSPVGPQIFEYIYMFRLCSVLSCIKHLYNYYPICSYTQCHTVDGWEILHQLGTIGIPVKHCKWWDCNRIKYP